VLVQKDRRNRKVQGMEDYVLMQLRKKKLLIREVKNGMAVSTF
jgi:hypothetical protein